MVKSPYWRNNQSQNTLKFVFSKSSFQQINICILFVSIYLSWCWLVSYWNASPPSVSASGKQQAERVNAESGSFPHPIWPPVHARECDTEALGDMAGATLRTLTFHMSNQSRGRREKNNIINTVSKTTPKMGGDSGTSHALILSMISYYSVR